MGWNQLVARVDIQQNLEEIVRIQAQNRAAVGANVEAHALQPCLQFLDRRQIGQVEHVVNFARGTCLFVDVAYFAAEQKAHLTATGGRYSSEQWFADFVFEFEEFALGWFELLAYLFQPAGVSDIASNNQRDAFELCPAPKLFQGEVSAGGA